MVMVEEVMGLKGNIDILVNNGGIIYRVLVIDFLLLVW